MAESRSSIASIRSRAGFLPLPRLLKFSIIRCRAMLAVGGFSGSLVCDGIMRSEEHTSELQSLMRISYAVFCLKKKKTILIKQEVRALVYQTNITQWIT